jgi:hypothetical protein
MILVGNEGGQGELNYPRKWCDKKPRTRKWRGRVLGVSIAAESESLKSCLYFCGSERRMTNDAPQEAPVDRKKRVNVIR